MAVETKCVHLLLLLVASFCIRNGYAQYTGQACTASDGQRGSCIIASQCVFVMNLVKQYGLTSPQASLYLANSNCGYDGRYRRVCCPGQSSAGGGNQDTGIVYPGQGGNQNTGGNGQGNGGQNSADVRSVLPDDCGVGEDNKIIDGTATRLDEFPWMAMIEYTRYGQVTTGCGGVLISRRYVLTAAHCILNVPSTMTLRGVRLGEYNVNTDPDCVPDGPGVTCAKPAISVPYESYVTHENYNNPSQFRNDIALIRLAYDVQETRYIKPICLPMSPAVSQRYTAAGWGQTETSRGSEVKLKVSLDYVDPRQCAFQYNKKGIVLGEGQMCTGGKAGQDTCKGDSGGPLMKQTRLPNDRWVVDGVVSIGHSPCALPDWPGVYTKVYNYVPWIHSKLRR